MDWAIFWAIIAVAATIAGVFVTIFVFRRQNPRRRLRYSITQSQLLNVRNERIQVLYEGRAVHAPYSTFLDIFSDSRADIPSHAFDRGRPLIFDFGDEILSASPTTRNKLSYTVHGSAIHVPPQLIRKKTGAGLTLILDGRTRLCIVDNPLIDIQVDGGPDAEWLAPRGTRALTALLIAASSMAVVVAGLLVSAFAFNVF